MDAKTSSQKHSSANIPYVRTYEGSSSSGKSNGGPNFIFHYKTSLFAVIFSTLSVGCFIMIMVYYNMQIGGLGSKKFEAESDLPYLPRVSLDIDPELREAIMEMTSDDLFIRNMPFLQDELADYEGKSRKKRQINFKNPTDCKSHQKECPIILKAVREASETMSSHLEQLKNRLVQLDVLSANDPQDVNYQKIVDCLQCANAIMHKQDEEAIVDHALSQDDHQSNTYISEVLPYFDNQHFADDDEQKESSEEVNQRTSDDRIGRGVSKQVMESVTNSSKMSNGAKITEILHNTTIIEKEEDETQTNNRDQEFQQHPVDTHTTGTRGETQVTRNMMGGGVTPMMMPTAESTVIYQQDPYGRPSAMIKPHSENTNIPAGLQPYILPTAETTKYSQQIQITPQTNSPLIPVCFYNNNNNNNPSAVTPQQQQQNIFPPQGANPGFPNQPSHFFPSNNNGQSPVPFGFQSNLPAQFFQSNSGHHASPPFPTMNQSPGQPNAPYYCTYIPMSNVPPQAFPQMPMANNFQNPFIGRNSDSESEPEEKETEVDKQLGKSTYDDSDEKYWPEQCDGFTCPPPYKKCIRHDQRCDGRVDCIGAEDEIDCPVVEDPYYSRSEPQQDESKPMEDITKTITTFLATTPSTPSMDTTDSNDVETTTFKIILPEMPKQFKCKRIIQTVSLDKRCDGVFDCEDTSDEEGCTCKDYLQHQRPSAVCDGHVDCDDSTDEQGCNFCTDDEYHCHRSGGCIPRNKVCNQANDCKLNEDELDCFVLSDGKRVNLDLDKRPHLNLAGVLTRYERGSWRATCFHSEYRSQSKRMNAGQKICEYLGFRNVDTVNEVIVPKSRLEIRSATSDFPISYEYPPQFTPMRKGDNNTCYGLYIRCKPILDRKVNVNLKINPDTKERSYLWPWEGSVFVDGKYHCPAVLLENDLMLASSKYAEDIDLSKNYTTAVFGVSSPDVPYSGPYQQASQIIDVRPIKNSDASLIRLKNDVKMTRYVQPIYLEKRIFPASKSDSCVAIGVNEKGQRKMKFLQPIVDNCPKCHRCYIDRNEATCSRANETTNWSGNIVCLSANGGWYPTATFQDKDENCGFSNKQTLNSIDYIHAHLSEAIDEQRSNIVEPFCEGVRCGLGECIPWNRVCDGIRDCRNGIDESHDICTEYSDRCKENISECKCSQAELRCGNGKCVPKEKFCDGKLDCEDGSDEPASCTCAEYLKLTKPQLVCDNRRHCLDKSDEDPQNCYCKDASFKCQKSETNGTMPCVPPDFVCDGQLDCPNGEDESDYACLTIKSGKFEAHGRGEIQKRTYGVWQTMCMSEPVKSLDTVREACVKLGYTAGLLLDGSKTADAIYTPRNDFYMFQPNNHTWVTLRDDDSFGVWVKPAVPCYKLHVHCF